MTNPTITFDRLQTLSRQMFDPETISITVGKNEKTERLHVVIRDEKTSASETIIFDPTATEDQVKWLLHGAAEELKLIPA